VEKLDADVVFALARGGGCAALVLEGLFSGVLEGLFSGVLEGLFSGVLEGLFSATPGLLYPS